MFRLLALIALWSAAAWPAAAQEGAAYFDGKTVTYIVSTDPGGGYDTYGRLIAEFMEKHLPGSTFVVENRPGAGNLLGANTIYASEPDGLTIGTFNTGLIYGQVAGRDGIRFDLAKMSWIGKAASDPRVILVSSESGIDSVEELAGLSEEVKFAACGIGCAAMVESTILFRTLGLPIKIITGYEGDEEQLAMRRGEVAGVLSSRSSQEQFVQEGHARYIAQIGGSETDLPQLATFAQDATAQRAIALVEAQASIGRLTAGPPDIPADRLAALVEAYRAATSDPEFLARAKSLGLPIDPLYGEELAAQIRGALDQPREVVELLRGALK